MKKLIAIAITLTLVLAAAARADGSHCNQQCASDESQCVTRLGAASTGNCSDGFRLCVQRCDPQRMNTAFLDSDAARRMLVRRTADSGAQRCNNNCALSARSCVGAANDRNQCRNAQLACEDRCSAS